MSVTANELSVGVVLMTPRLDGLVRIIEPPVVLGDLVQLSVSSVHTGRRYLIGLTTEELQNTQIVRGEVPSVPGDYGLREMLSPLRCVVAGIWFVILLAVSDQMSNEGLANLFILMPLGSVPWVIITVWDYRERSWLLGAGEVIATFVLGWIISCVCSIPFIIVWGLLGVLFGK